MYCEDPADAWDRWYEYQELNQKEKTHENLRRTRAHVAAPQEVPEEGDGWPTLP